MAGSKAIVLGLVLLSIIFINILNFPAATCTSSAVGAIYFSTNALEGNHVIINSIKDDGTLEFYSAIPTNGSGISGKSAELGSADSMIVGDNYLFVVNANSDSVSMFGINPEIPAEIKLIDTASSCYNTPTSLAYSSVLRMLCVSCTGRPMNGLACFSVTPSGLTVLPDTIKPYGLALPENTGDEKSVAGTASDVLFTANSKQLLVSVKSNPGANPPTKGIIASYPITSPTSLGEPFVNSPIGNFPYSMTLVPGSADGDDDNQAFIFTDPDPVMKSTPGLVLAQISTTSGKVTSGIAIPIPGHKLSCWSDFSNKTRNLFTIDFEAATEVKKGYGVISEFSVATQPTLEASMIKQYALQGPLIDSRTVTIPNGQDFLYVLRGGAENPTVSVGIYVMSVDQSGDATLMQNYTPKNTANVTLSSSVAGLAIYIKKY